MAQLNHQSFTGQLELLECARCGMTFGVAYRLVENARNRGGAKVDIYCPLGHTNVWHESEVDRVRKRLAIVEAEKQAAERQAEFQRTLKESAEAATLKEQAKLARLKKRVGAGVCPCCQRTFKQLAAHMATKHPKLRAKA